MHVDIIILMILLPVLLHLKVEYLMFFTEGHSTMHCSYTVRPKVHFNLIFFIEKALVTCVGILMGALIERAPNLALSMLDLKGL